MKGREILAYLALKYNGDWDKIYSDIQHKAPIESEEAVKNMLQKIKSNYITLVDSEYPRCLKINFKPPFVLFYYGDISLLKNGDNNVAIIGARNCSSYGVNMTEKITSVVAKDYSIVSGLARGIDSIAHKSAISSGGRTIAVLGSGIDYCYPKENKVLYDEIKNNHLLISEYPSMVEPRKENFPFRNRIIAALAKVTVVVEASYKSGTSTTVGWALELGKQVCCVPHLAGENSLCNKLISDGALLVESGNDVLKELDETQGIKEE